MDSRSRTEAVRAAQDGCQPRVPGDAAGDLAGMGGAFGGADQFTDMAARQRTGDQHLPAGAALLPQLGTYTEGAGCVDVRTLDGVDVDQVERALG